MIKEKKGLSPVIATVLLIGIVIVMAVIVFLWIRGIQDEAITKFDGKNVKIVCEDVDFQVAYNSPNLQILNKGTVPIYQMKGKVSGSGSHETINIDDNWDVTGLNEGAAVKSDISSKIDASSKTILLIPVLAGETKDGAKTYTCDDRFGQEITL